MGNQFIFVCPSEESVSEREKTGIDQSKENSKSRVEMLQMHYYLETVL